MTFNHREHPAAEDLVLHFYGDSPAPAEMQRHLAACAECAREYRAIEGTLKLIPAVTPPERSDLYGLEVWQRVRPQLPVEDAAWRVSWSRWNPFIVSAAAALLVVVAFAAGRYWTAGEVVTSSIAGRPVDSGSDERAWLVAIADHLERSERVLLDLNNADAPFVDLASQQEWAADLVESNRLYREAATQAGDDTIASVLDDLERNLLDIVHAPSTLSPSEFEIVRTRLDAAALLFKVRVLSNELRDREAAAAPAAPRKTT